MIIYLKNKHTLQIDDFYFKCCIVKNGLSKKKMEGDKKTTIGRFSRDTWRCDPLIFGKGSHLH